jgi:hypothetical protein
VIAHGIHESNTIKDNGITINANVKAFRAQSHKKNKKARLESTMEEEKAKEAEVLFMYGRRKKESQSILIKRV